MEQVALEAVTHVRQTCRWDAACSSIERWCRTSTASPSRFNPCITFPMPPLEQQISKAKIRLDLLKKALLKVSSATMIYGLCLWLHYVLCFWHHNRYLVLLLLTYCILNYNTFVLIVYGPVKLQQPKLSLQPYWYIRHLFKSLSLTMNNNIYLQS